MLPIETGGSWFRQRWHLGKAQSRSVRPMVTLARVLCDWDRSLLWNLGCCADSGNTKSTSMINDGLLRTSQDLPVLVTSAPYSYYPRRKLCIVLP